MTASPDRAPSGRRFGAPKNWRTTFLAALGDTSNVTSAAAKADISLSWVYKTKREDPEFARQWLGALCEGYDNLEMEVLHRLRTARSLDEDGNKYDIGMAIRLLTAHRAEMARARSLRDDDDEQSVLDSIDAMIDEMRGRSAANAAILAAEAGPGDDR